MFYTVEQIRQIERAAVAQGIQLMPQAGRALADFISVRFGKAARIVALVGPGNNGGDALFAATLLRERGYTVQVVGWFDATALPAPAARALAQWLAAGGTVRPTLPDDPATVYVDGLFGIGLNRPLPADYQALIQRVNALRRPVVAVDVPSGIDADSGRAWGEPIHARWTLSFIATARGLLTGAAVNSVGERHLAPLDLPQIALATATVANCADVAQHVTLHRPRDSHKGRFGTVAIVGAAPGMAGAGWLAGRAALHAGAGKVHIAQLDAEGPTIDPQRPELMLCPIGNMSFDRVNVLIIGPGLSQSPEALHWLAQLLDRAVPMVIDADALNLIAGDAHLRARLARRTAPTVMTPHPTEAARLLACDTAQIQAQRFDAAQQLSQVFACTVLLKGAGSVVASNPRLAVNLTGSAALANAGQGDVLSGLIGGLLAQGLDAWEATNLAVYCHGFASDQLHRHTGAVATLADDVAQACGRLLGRFSRDD